MEAKYWGNSNGYGQMVSEMKTVGKRSVEWDLNDWNWDGDLLHASAKNSAPLDCRSRQLFPVLPASPSDSDELGKGESEKRRKFVEGAGPINFQLGEQVYPIADSEGKGGKKSKGAAAGASQSVCQVAGCAADLSNAKDYHRRHKVCEVHSKATQALVGNALQRFCQQCSRFHALEEFDDGRRSCRRRLAGHNKRRRKTNPEPVANAGSLVDEKSAGQLLITLLKLLSNVHTNTVENAADGGNDHDLVSQLLRFLVGSSTVSNISGLLQGSQGSPYVGTSNGIADKDPSRIPEPSLSAQSTDVQRGLSMRENQGDVDRLVCGSQPRDNILVKGSLQEASVGRHMHGGIDLNHVYDDDVEDCLDLETANESVTHTFCTEETLPSPPQASGNSSSTSGRSSSSGSDTQYRTNQIVFKLFGKDPSDIPHALQPQILEWLSQSPTDIEGYIRPGCVVLTLYLRLTKSSWEEFCYDMNSSLSRLLDVSSDPFWNTGWIYTRIQQRAAFICDGQVVLDTPLPSESCRSKITSISPIAIPVGETVQLVVRGSYLSGPTSRLLCAIEGRYVVQESCNSLVKGTDPDAKQDEVQSLRFHCPMPNVVGRGFVESQRFIILLAFLIRWTKSRWLSKPSSLRYHEAEDGRLFIDLGSFWKQPLLGRGKVLLFVRTPHQLVVGASLGTGVEDYALSGCSFPFIVAKPEVCSEICTLERDIEVVSTHESTHEDSGKLDAKYEALDFIHEMGWLLHRSRLRFKLGQRQPPLNLFPFERLKWLITFSLDHDWCAVLRELLDFLFDGTVDISCYASMESALSDMALLHTAVKNKSRPMVEFLLRYVPKHVESTLVPEQKKSDYGRTGSMLFRPDLVGAGGWTPLHIAASSADSYDVLDALLEDPGMVGIEAWKNARDITGLTPCDYASSREHSQYNELAQKKIYAKSAGKHVVLDIASLSKLESSQGRPSNLKSVELNSLYNLKVQLSRNCKVCELKPDYRYRGTSLAFRPTVLSLVAIAVVCVCTALLFKSGPAVGYLLTPFKWEALQSGAM